MTNDMEAQLNRLGRDYRNIPVPPELASAIILKARECPARSTVPPWEALAIGLAAAVLVWLIPWLPGPAPEDRYLPSLSRVVLPPYPGAPNLPSVNISLSDIGGVPPLPRDAKFFSKKPAVSRMPVPSG